MAACKQANCAEMSSTWHDARMDVPRARCLSVGQRFALTGVLASEMFTIVVPDVAVRCLLSEMTSGKRMEADTVA